MSLRLTRALAVFIFPLSATVALAQDSEFTVFGQGTRSCANWLSSAHWERDGSVWILGFFSGRNSLNDVDHHVGSRSDTDAIIGATKKICTAKPSTNLVDAAMRAYQVLRQKAL